MVVFICIYWLSQVFGGNLFGAVSVKDVKCVWWYETLMQCVLLTYGILCPFLCVEMFVFFLPAC